MAGIQLRTTPSSTAEGQIPLRKFNLFSILLILTAASFACAPTQVEPPPAVGTPVLLTLPPPDATAKPTPREVTARNPIPTPTPVSGAAAVSNTPLPVPAATLAPAPPPTPTSVPRPSPIPTDGRVSTSPGEEAGAEDFLENFVSIAYEASFDMPSELNEGGYPVAATVSGWLTMGTPADPTSQLFMKIEMTKPIQRSIEVVSRPNTLSMYLHDLDAKRWYYLPENSAEVDIGPVEDISHVSFFGMLFSAWPRDEAQQTLDGYIREFEDPAFGTVTITYDQEYTIETLTRTDHDGKQILHARYFDINKIHDLVPYEPAEELLPDAYWQSQ